MVERSNPGCLRRSIEDTRASLKQLLLLISFRRRCKPVVIYAREASQNKSRHAAPQPESRSSQSAPTDGTEARV